MRYGKEALVHAKKIVSSGDSTSKTELREALCDLVCAADKWNRTAEMAEPFLSVIREIAEEIAHDKVSNLDR